MIWIVLTIGVATLVAGMFVWGNTRHECIGNLMSIVGGAVTIAALATAIGLLVNMGSYYGLDEKIEMYEAENISIEEDISFLVHKYMNYEEGIFSECARETMTLVALYPELKSNTLVEKQIETYVSNNNTIKELKSRRITASLYNWWLYFGD